jgi:predicted TPR repeat methyltransferase
MEKQVVVTLFEQGKFAEAEKFAQSLTQGYPQHPFGWKLLGAALMQQDKAADALKPMQMAATLAPSDAEAISNLGGTLEKLGHLVHAEACYQRALEVQPGFSAAIENLIEVLVAQKKYKEAAPLMRQRLGTEPVSEYMQHLLAMYEGQHTETAPAGYVTEVFDGYADKFDTHLQDTLGYKVPQLLVDLVGAHQAWTDKSSRVLDLGCGTGLVGLALAEKTANLVGVDLSAKMLEKAQARGLYQRLVCADILSTMRQEPEGSYDLIVSADVFIYVGRIDDVVTEARRLLRPGGLFAFSIETLLPPADAPSTSPLDIQLQTSGRFKHSLDYIERLAREGGLSWLEKAMTPIRTEHSLPVEGCLVVWQR